MDDLELVAEECLIEYENLQNHQTEPSQADKILEVKPANVAFKYEARNLQVINYLIDLNVLSDYFVKLDWEN